MHFLNIHLRRKEILWFSTVILLNCLQKSTVIGLLFETLADIERGCKERQLCMGDWDVTIQSNLSTTVSHGELKKWPLLTCDRCSGTYIYIQLMLLNMLQSLLKLSDTRHDRQNTIVQHTNPPLQVLHKHNLWYFFVTIFISFLHVHVIVTKHSYNIRRKKKEKKSPQQKERKK